MQKTPTHRGAYTHYTIIIRWRYAYVLPHSLFEVRVRSNKLSICEIFASSNFLVLLNISGKSHRMCDLGATRSESHGWRFAPTAYGTKACMQHLEVWARFSMRVWGKIYALRHCNAYMHFRETTFYRFPESIYEYCKRFNNVINYLLRFVSSSSSVSETVMIRELAWKPRWVVIISVNSAERSTLDISSTPDCM